MDEQMLFKFFVSVPFHSISVKLEDQDSINSTMNIDECETQTTDTDHIVLIPHMPCLMLTFSSLPLMFNFFQTD